MALKMPKLFGEKAASAADTDLDMDHARQLGVGDEQPEQEHVDHRPGPQPLRVPERDW